ncbi:MAG TPA: GNAT family N-acetyltransferase [Nevskia sp.]|jgi:ribosomal protein S18 acetylase RimI-like enzyme|nr:GNAT family N-acetyltransferase [Nevskia sp.]
MPAPAPSVRRAGLSDLDALTPLFDAYRQFYGKPADLPLARRFLQERLERRESVIFLAETDGAAAGFTQLYPAFSSVSAARSFILNDLYVREEARRHGIAQSLLRAAADFGRAEKAVTLSLATAIHNHQAQALYASQGWVRDGDFLTYNLAL